MTTRRTSPPRRSPPRQRAKRSVGWLNSTVIDQTTAVGAETTLDLLGGLTFAEKRIVARVEVVFGSIHFRSIAANATILGRYGIIVVGDDALAAGALPDPFGDDESSWMWNRELLWDRTDLEHTILEIRTRTRRLIPQGSTLAFVLENSALSANTMGWNLGLRLLYLKH